MASGTETVVSNTEQEEQSIIKFPRYRKAYFFVKRLLDIVVSIVSLIPLSPIFILVALIVKLDSKGPILFKQGRMGLHMKPFTVYKFRTMKTDAPKACATAELENAEAYITRVGKYLRRWSIDELPQLFNVVKGDMSLIGPRPVVLTETELIERRRLAGVYHLRPGISGWAQINGRDLVTVEEKVQYDQFYLNQISLSFDLKVFMKSILYVLKGKGVQEGAPAIVQANCNFTVMEDGGTEKSELNRKQVV